MGYFKLIPYVFLLIAIIFTIDSVIRLRNGEDALITILFAAGAVFMFFFKRYQYRNFNKNTRK